MASSSVSFNPVSPITPEKYTQKLLTCETDFKKYLETAKRLEKIIPSDLEHAVQFKQVMAQCHAIYQKLTARLIKLNTPVEKKEISSRITALQQAHDKVQAALKEGSAQAEQHFSQELATCQTESQHYLQGLSQLSFLTRNELSTPTEYQTTLSCFMQCNHIYSTLRARLEKLGESPEITKRITLLDGAHRNLQTQLPEHIDHKKIYYVFALFASKEFHQIASEWECAYSGMLLPFPSHESVQDRYTQCQAVASKLIEQLGTILARNQQLSILDPLYSARFPEFYTVPIALASMNATIEKLAATIRIFSDELYPLELLTKNPFAPIPIPPRTISDMRGWLLDPSSKTHFAQTVEEKFPSFQETSDDGDSFISAIIVAYLMHAENRETLLHTIECATRRGSVMNKVEDLLVQMNEHPEQICSLLNQDNNLLLMIHYFRSMTSKLITTVIRTNDLKKRDERLDPNHMATLGTRVASENAMMTVAFAFKKRIELYDLDQSTFQTFTNIKKNWSTLFLAKKGDRHLVLHPPSRALASSSCSSS